MPKSHTNRGALLTSNLPQLQNLIKRDPKAYREEFLQQWTHYQSILRIFKLNPTEHAQHFRELTSFISQVIQCYSKEAAEFPNDLVSLLSDSYQAINSDIRRSLVQNLVMLRNKNVIGSIDLLKTLFPLLPRTTSSSLRSHIRKTILTDIKTANAKSKNHKVNRAVQAMLFAMVERGMDADVQGDKGKLRAFSGTEGAQKPANAANAAEALWAVVLTKELWRKGVWNDAKCVSIVALACFHPVAKVQNAALHFFLGADEEEDTDSESDGETPDIKTLEHRRTINKKTRSGEKKMAKSKKVIKKNQKDKKDVQPNFPALQLINDPQTFGEKLYDNLVKYDKRYSLDHKVLMMQLLGRVMGVHKLCVLGFYTYIIKYLTHHQLQITLILVSLAQSTHDLTPPDVLTPVIRKLAQEFVHPGVGPEVVAAGINAIREVCRRQPWCMEEDLLGDLIAYRKSRDKGVVTASRGLLQLYREVNPSMLKRRERGKEASMGMHADKPLPYGYSRDAAVDIEGLRLLEDHLDAQRVDEDDEMEDDEAAWKGWDLESNSSDDTDDSGSWHDVESGGEEAFGVSDSDDKSPKGVDKGRAKDIGWQGGEEKEDVEMTDEAPRVSTLVTTKILTPADFALLQELRIKAARKAVEAGGGSGTKRRLAVLEAQKRATAVSSAYDEDNSATLVTESAILGVQKKKKADYEERMASIQKGREGREKFGSYKGKKRKASQSSSTNREKRRNKPLMMVIASNAVRSKKQASLKDKQKRLRAHIERAKKAYH